MDDLPGFGIFLVVGVLLNIAGSALGYAGKRTSWRVPMHIAGFCLGIAEPLLFVLYHQHILSLVRAFYTGGMFLAVGAFAFGFGTQRLLKAQKAEKAAQPSA